MSRAHTRAVPASLSPAQAQRIAASFLAARRTRHGTATMTAPPQTDQQQGGQTDQGGSDGGQQGQQQAEQPKKLDLTQADLDRIIGERLAAERSRHEQALKDAQALAGKNETEKLTIERDQATQRAQEATAKAAERIARTEAKVAAIAAGANPDRVAAIVRNADLAAAVKDGDVDETAIKAAVEKVLTEYPEWKASAQQQAPSASGGELNGGQTGKPSFTRKQLEEMPPDEMAARIDEINDAIADGRVTG